MKTDVNVEIERNKKAIKTIAKAKKIFFYACGKCPIVVKTTKKEVVRAIRVFGARNFSIKYCTSLDGLLFSNPNIKNNPATDQSKQG